MEDESTIRLGGFLGVLLFVAVVESLFPRRKLTYSKPFRWFNNLALTALNTAIIRLLIPLTAVAVAEFASQKQWGILHWLPLVMWAKILIAVVLLDCLIYWQHVISHSVPMLWGIHQVHHTDHDIDLTTGLRFHPIEISLSMLLKMAAIVVLGAPAIAVMIFEILLNATAMFNHGNLFLPGWLDKMLRLFLVTPDMHRIHHSVDVKETNSNYGFNLPWWDYLFRTYRQEPCLGHQEMQIGLPKFPESDVQRLDTMLSLPFRQDLEEPTKPN